MKRVDAKRSRQPVRSQQGFTLIEAIVATVVVSIVIATAITGLTTMSNASTHANGNARIDALLSGYGEGMSRHEVISYDQIGQVEMRPHLVVFSYE